MLQTIDYKGYLFKERSSVCEEDSNYWAIYKFDKNQRCYKFITCLSSLSLCKYNVDNVFNYD